MLIALAHTYIMLYFILFVDCFGSYLYYVVFYIILFIIKQKYPFTCLNTNLTLTGLSIIVR